MLDTMRACVSRHLKKSLLIYFLFFIGIHTFCYGSTEEEAYLDCVDSAATADQPAGKICRRMFFYRSHKPIADPQKIAEKDWDLSLHTDDRARTTLPFVVAKIELAHFSEQKSGVVFQLGGMSTAKAELRVPDDKDPSNLKTIAVTGHDIESHRRPMSHHHFLLPFKDITPKTKTTVFISINTAYGNRNAEIEMLPLNESTLATIEARDMPKHFALGGFAVLAIYHLFVYINLKDILYLRYVLLILFTYVILILQQSGYISRFFPSSADFLNHNYPWLSFLGMMSAISFLKNFITKYHNKWISILATFCIYVYGIDFVFFHWNFVDYFGYGGTVFTKINNFSIFIALILILICVIQASRVYRPAKFLLYAFSLPVIIASIMILDKVITHFFSQKVFINSLLWSVVGEGLLFSFALSDRFVFLRKEFSKLRSAKIISDEKTKHISRIEALLETVEHGIILLSEHAVIETASKYTEKIFEKTQKELLGQKLESIFSTQTDLEKDAIDLLFVAFDAIYQENPLAWEVNNHLFPQKIILKTNGKTKILEANWSIIVANDVITDVVLAVTDRTEAEMREQTIKQKDEQTTRLAVVMSHLANQRVQHFAHTISDSFLDSHTSIHSLKQTLKDDSQTRDQKITAIHHALRTYHTIKGMMRTYLASDCASFAHHIEDELTSLTDKNVSFEALDKACEGLHNALQAYQMIFSKLGLSLEKSKTSSQNRQNPFEAFLATEFFHIQQSLQQAGLELLDFRVVDEVKLWPEESLKVILQILPLAIANIIDHGYLLPRAAGEKRERYGAKLSFIARKFNNKIKVELMDDGYGINIGKLFQLAEKHHVDIQSLGDPTEILFTDGVSTAGKISEKSGRGVGLSAIRAMAEHIGGEAKITGSLNGGTILTILLP